jgi:hypothetical protein
MVCMTWPGDAHLSLSSTSQADCIWAHGGESQATHGRGLGPSCSGSTDPQGGFT